MGATSRTKGNAGEREIAVLIRDLTGHDVRRRVRQHDGDSDLMGVPGWSIEVKRHARALRSDIAAWWQRAVQQASDGVRPVLFYRQDRDQWHAVWALGPGINSIDYAMTVERSVERKLQCQRQRRAARARIDYCPSPETIKALEGASTPVGCRQCVQHHRPLAGRGEDSGSALRPVEARQGFHEIALPGNLGPWRKRYAEANGTQQSTQGITVRALQA